MSDGIYIMCRANTPLFDEDGEYNYEIFVSDWILNEMRENI